jgi:hypothetical protein
MSRQNQLPTMRSRILWQGDLSNSVWFVSDVDATLPSSPTLSDKDIESLYTSLVGVIDDEHGPFVTFEPYLCPMPSC